MKYFEEEIVGKIEIYKPKFNIFTVKYVYDINEGHYYISSDIGASHLNKFVFDNYKTDDDFRDELAKLFNTEIYNIYLII